MTKNPKRWLFAAFCAAWVVCGAQTALFAQITKNDVEFISWKFENSLSDGRDSFVMFRNLSLITLNSSAAKRNPRLHNFLNELLYDGLTAQAYIKTRLKSFLQFNLEMLEEENLSVWNKEADPSDRWYYTIAGFYEESFTWDIRGKYLLLTRKSYGGFGSSYEELESYIIDTALLKKLSADDIIADSSNPNFQRLVWNSLSRTDNFEGIAKYQDFFYQSLKKRDYVLFFNESGIVFFWNEGQTPAGKAWGSFEAVVRRSEIEPYLTVIGKEILR